MFAHGVGSVQTCNKLSGAALALCWQSRGSCILAGQFWSLGGEVAGCLFLPPKSKLLSGSQVQSLEGHAEGWNLLGVIYASKESTCESSLPPVQ